VLQDKLAATESAMQSLQTDLKNLRNLKNAQDSTILEIKKSNALLELQRDEVNQRLAMIFHDRAELEVEYERTKGRLNDLLNHHVGAQAFSKLTDECSKLHRKLKETEAKYESLQIAYAQISTEYTLIRSDTSLLSPDSAVSAPSAVETSDLSKRARNNISKMRALEQKLDAEIAMRASAEAEVSELRRRNQTLETEVEDIKRIGGGGRIRASSTVSSLSSLLNVKDTVTPRKLKIRSLFLPGTPF
jgi:chromosome segregation ATPase